MRRPVAFVILIFIALASLSFANARASEMESFAFASSAKQIERDGDFWVGDYTFTEDGGKTAGGSAIFVIHSLAIRKEAGTLLAEITSQGYQTSRSLAGVVKVAGNEARVYFKSYGEGNMYEPYREGDLLLTLRRVAQRGRTRILTYWNAFEPAVKPLGNGRVYFKRERA
jgi:hypothetical protein